MGNDYNSSSMDLEIKRFLLPEQAAWSEALLRKNLKANYTKI